MTKDRSKLVFFRSMDQLGLVLNGPVAVLQYLGLVRTSCSCQLPHLGSKNQTELDLQTLGMLQVRLGGMGEVLFFLWGV